MVQRQAEEHSPNSELDGGVPICEDYQPSHPEWTLAAYNDAIGLKFGDTLRASLRGIRDLREVLNDQQDRSLLVEVLLALGSGALTAMAAGIGGVVARAVLGGAGEFARSILSRSVRDGIREVYAPALEALRPQGRISADLFLNQQEDTLDLAAVRAREGFRGEPARQPQTLQAADQLYLAMDAAYLSARQEQYAQSLAAWMG